MTQRILYLARAACVATCLLLMPAYAGAQVNLELGNGLIRQGAPLLRSPMMTTVTTGGPWFAFMFYDVGSFAVDCAGSCAASSGENSVDAGSPPWTFSSTSWRKLTVTDWYFVGDQFMVYDFDQSIGTTSLADGTDYYFCGTDPDVCVADPRASHGIFILEPGDHSITIQVIASPFGIGAALFRVDNLFAGTPGQANCHGMSVSALARQYVSLANAAAQLGFPSVEALQIAIVEHCGN